jgi:quercetin dioxygenase-like cupin family protein
MTAAKGFVVAAGGGKHFASPTLGRSFAMKLLGRETGESIMMFEETLPPGTTSLFHLHHDSDEVAWVLAGEITFKIGDEVTVGGPGTCAFMPRDVPQRLEEHRQRNRPRLVSVHPGRRRRIDRGTRRAPPD